MKKIGFLIAGFLLGQAIAHGNYFFAAGVAIVVIVASIISGLRQGEN